MPKVDVPPRYRGPTRGESTIEVEGETVRACIEAVEALYPGFSELIFDPDGSVRRYVRIFVNEEPLNRDASDTSVSAEDRIQVLASAAGG